MSKFRDREILTRILSNYPIKVVDIKKVRSAYKIYTDKESFCLKKSKRTKEKVEKVNLVIEYLHENGFTNVPKVLKTNDSKLCTKYKKDFYYIMEWVNGEEIDFSNNSNVKNAVELLAEYNKTLVGFNPSGVNVEYKYLDIEKEFGNKIQEIGEYTKTIDKRRIKGKFDYEYIENMEPFVNMGKLAIEILKESNFAEKIKNVNNLTLAHDSFYYQNILVTKDGKYYIVDLDQCAQNILVYDLGKFIRRMMCKNEYMWDFNKANELINCYTKIKPLDSDDMKILFAIIIFPHKFWKVGRKRYKKNKEWLEEKYIKKLNDIIIQKPLVDKFIEDYREFYKI